LVVRLPDGWDDQKLADTAAEHGIRVSALSRYYIGTPGAVGLVVGFGYAPSEKIARAGRILAQILRSAP
jgi:GntR family transcriptional regulator/MocR family aminotransferase